MEDAEFISLVQRKGRSMDDAIGWFYREHFRLVYQKESEHRLTKEQVIDAYSDAIISLKNNLIKGSFKGDSKLSTYFITIFNRKCIDIIRKETTHLIYEHELPLHLKDNTAGIDEQLTVEVNLGRLYKILKQMSEVCRKVLMDWNDGYSMDEIAKRNNLSNAHTARSKRYNCFQQLMNLVDD